MSGTSISSLSSSSPRSTIATGSVVDLSVIQPLKPTQKPSQLTPKRPAPNPTAPYAGTSAKPRLEAPAKDQPIKTIYVNPGNPGTVDADAVVALQAIGARRGFTVETQSGVSGDRWSEDNAIVFRDAAGRTSVLVSNVKGDDFEQAKFDLAKMAGDSPTGDTSTTNFGSLGLGRAFADGLSAEIGEQAKAKGWDVKTSPIAIDGGNILTMRNKAGETVSLVGRNSLLANWRVLVNTKQIDPAAVNRNLTSKSFDPALSSEFQQMAKKTGKPITAEQANRMAAEVEVTKGVMAQTLNLDPKKVVFVEQAGFHIDMETRPIGDGKVMVSSLTASRDMLKQSINQLNATSPSASRSQTSINAEKAQLTDLLNRTEKSIAAGDQNLLDRKAKTLEKAGLTVVRAATNFGSIASDHSPDNARNPGAVNVNFANGIAASDKSGSTYFITNQSASDTLNKNFSDTMKNMGIAVEWTPTGSLLSALGGIDCITLHTQVPRPGARDLAVLP